MNTELFIKLSISKFGNKFSFDKVNYINDRTHVIVTCVKHGDIKKFPYTFIKSKYGCNECFNEKRKSIAVVNFIERAILKHGNKFDYSKVNYNTLDDEIIIICPIHGEFNQTGTNHLKNKHGCPNCAIDSQKVKINDFVKISNQTHGNKYDYSLVKYDIIDDKVKIICPIHGIFLQKASNHMRYRGCRKCNSHPMDTTTFIQKSIKIHGELYSYENTEYIPSRRPRVNITCKIHGEFNQLVRAHLQGSGCPKCRNSKGEIAIGNILDELGIIYEKEFRFKDCKYKRALPFDFYLLDYGACIEYHGEQHYYPAKLWGDFDGKRLQLQQVRDDIKRKYCSINNIPLIEIKYTSVDIKSEICDFINKLKQEK